MSASEPVLLASNLLPLLKSRLRDAARRVRYLPERILHSYRRRRAPEVLKDLVPAARSFVFLCYDNIYRSPFAAEVFRQAAVPPEGDLPAVASAGICPVGGRRVPGEAVKAAREWGRPVGTQVQSRRRAFGLQGWVESVIDGFFAMGAAERDRLARKFDLPRSKVFVLAEFDSEPVRRRALHDLFGDSLEIFERVYDQIQRCVGEVARLIGIGSSNARV